MLRSPRRNAPTILAMLALALLLAACSQPAPTPQQPTLELTLADASLAALPGDEVAVTFSVVRGGGFEGPVAVSTADVPTGIVPPSPVTVAAGASDGSFTLTLSEDLPPGATGLTIVAQGDGVLATAALALDVAELNGRLDEGFGADGVFRYERNGAQFADVALDASGRIVAVGWWYSGVDVPLIVRLTADGALDPAFGSGGVLEIDLGVGVSGRLRTVAIDGSGRIVAAGDLSNPADCFAARVDANGSLDATFAGDGVAEIDSGASDDCNDVIVDSSGRTVVVGDASSDQLIARLDGAGVLDATFDADGIAVYDPLTASDDLYAVVETGSGDLIAAGRVRENDRLADFALIRLDPDGSLDAGFGGGGLVATDIATSNDEVRALALDGDRIVAAGYSGFGPGGNEDIALARYAADGGLDPAFGDGGTVGIDLFGLYDTALDLAVDPSGGYVAVGYGYRDGYSQQLMAVVAVDADGALDPSFNRDGKAVLDELPIGAANAVAIDADGDIVLAGYDGSGAVVARVTR